MLLFLEKIQRIQYGVRMPNQTCVTHVSVS